MMRFCPQCGASVVAGAKFCVECGEPLGQTAAAGAGRRMRATPAFAAVFGGILLIGLAVAVIVIRQTKGPERASSPSPAANLPAGHPKVELPPEARKFIDDLERTANSKPNDIAAWNQFGEVALRASMFDEGYYAKAVAAYGHVLKLEPDNLEALRGIGNLNYDRRNYDQAIAAYEHYLTRKPDDAEVRTDLGTMYLYTGNADQAIVQYKKVLADKPDFFEAYYNLGIAYEQQNNDAEAKAAFDKALQLAPDDKTKGRVKEMLAKLGAEKALPGAAAAPSPVAQDEGTFESSIERLVRGLPVAGAKVKSVEWPSRLKARVVMDNFPIDQMPPFAKQKFVNDIKSGIESAKASHKVTGTFELDLADATSGRTMETISR